MAGIDSLSVVWNSGKRQTIRDFEANQLVSLKEVDATSITMEEDSTPPPLFEPIPSPIEFQNPDIFVNDFRRQSLLISQLSYSGPCLTKGDINKDGLLDIIAGGAKGQAASLYIQRKSGEFLKQPVQAFEMDKNSEDTEAIFFDANGNGHTDIYIVSGGYHQYLPDDPNLQDRLMWRRPPLRILTDWR